MKPELPSTETGEMTSLHSREVEYALILSQMISVAEDNPSQMRLAIYEFARAKLNFNTSFAHEAERKTLSAALEAAILGVEKFSAARDERTRVQFETAALQVSDKSSVGEDMPPLPMLDFRRHGATSNHNSQPGSADWFSNFFSTVASNTWMLASRRNWFAIGLSLVAVFAGLAFFTQRKPFWRAEAKPPATAIYDFPKQAVTTPPAAAATDSGSRPSSFPSPSDYGVYAFNSGTALIELHALTEQVPDRRVAMSTPIAQPSRTTLPDGNAKFVIFRRDFAINAPDRFDVRAVARIKRVMTFDPKGKPTFSSTSAGWIIRNIVYEYKVRPVPGNAEMLLVQPKDPDVELPPGRYVLALKEQGFDFNVAGNIADPSQCLERTDAVNGSFYSDCQSQ